MTKPVVHFVGEAFLLAGGVGGAFLDEVLDHPSLGHAFDVRTSKVVSHNETTGDFETLNTRYVKVLPPLEADPE